MCYRYGHEAKVVHFLGKAKPWNYSYDAQRGEVRGHSPSPGENQLHPDYLLIWWQLYGKSVLPLLQKSYGDTPFNSGLIEASNEVCCGLVQDMSVNMCEHAELLDEPSFFFLIYNYLNAIK